MRYLELGKAYNKFFNSICLAFQENNVPSETVGVAGEKIPVVMPYLTYQVIDTNNREQSTMQVNVWSKSSSYKELYSIVDKIEDSVGEGVVINFGEGRGGIILHKGLPFAQNINDPDSPTIKRAVINLEVQVYY